MTDKDDEKLGPMLEPQPDKHMFLYVCELADATVAAKTCEESIYANQQTTCRRATYRDMGKLGFAPEAIPKRVWLAVDSLAEYVAAYLDEYEGAPKKYGESEGKRRLAELRTALAQFGYSDQADAQGWRRDG